MAGAGDVRGGDRRGSADGSEEREQLRLALVLNGGVSLAVWMGGAVREVDRLAKGDGAYRLLLGWVASEARVDVISGTSAGGINGAALALSQSNKVSQGVGLLRDVWLDSGSFTQLLRQPFHGSPPSLLRGDEYFLPELNRAFRRLAEPYEATDVAQRPLDLTITTTLLTGIPGVSVDHTGQRIAQTRHDGLLRFQRGPTHRLGSGGDDFSDEALARGSASRVLDALALAARSTASYPVAFEPSYLPGGQPAAVNGHGPLRPDLSGHMAGAWDQAGTKHARFAVDGGVLANTPTRPALEAIDRMPAEGLVRRVLLLVHPHASAPGEDRDDLVGEPPTLAGVGGSVLGALTSEGGRNYVHLIEEHNRVAGSRRDLRAEVVRLAVPGRRQPPGATFGVQAALAYPWYRVVRLHRAARELFTVWLERDRAEGLPPESPGQVVPAVLGQLQRRVPPWLPDPDEELPAPRLLGFEGAIGIADTAVDYLRRAMWASACARADTQEVRRAREGVSQARNAILRLREEFLQDARRRAARMTDLSGWVEDMVGRFGDTELHAALEAAVGRIAEHVAQVHAPAPPAGLDPAGAEAAHAEALRGFQALLELPPAAAGGRGAAGDPDLVLRRLNEIQLLTYVLSDEVTTGNSLPIDLVQLTYQVRHPFAPHLSGEDKVAGDLLSRFSAFLKRSWRLNDWTWGRLDAAQVLCRTVLEPDRVRRHVAATAARTGADFAGAARRLVDELYEADPGRGVAGLPGVPTAEEVYREVSALEAAAGAPGQASAPLTQLPAYFAAVLATGIAGEELPGLVGAVEQDVQEGANARSRGCVYVTANKEVFERAREGDAAACWEALEAFATAGIGSETVASEGSSDALIATATTAAATAVTVLDSDRSGLGFLQPVTRTIRGAALLPYWVITGLTTGGRLARGLAIIALAAGAVLLTLGLLGVGPAWGVAVGTAAVLGAFAYGALRSGTPLHSAVLLVPAVALLVWAARASERAAESAAAGSGAGAGATGAGAVGAGAAAGPSAEAGPVTVLVAFLLLVVGLMVLGSLKPPLVSPLAWARARWATVVAAVAALVILGLLLNAPFRVGLADWWAALLRTPAVASLVSAVRELPWQLGLLALLAYVLAAALYTYRVGTRWRLVVLKPVGADARAWGTDEVEHPAGTSVGWSWVYGLLLLAACALLMSWTGVAWPAQTWARGSLLGLGLGGLLLLLPVPWLVDRRASHRLRRQAATALSRLADDAREDGAGEDAEKKAQEDARVRALFAAGLNYARLVGHDGTPVGGAIWDRLRLTDEGQRAWADSRQRQRGGAASASRTAAAARPVP